MYTHVLPVELSKQKIQKLRRKIDSKNSVFKDKRYLEALGIPVKIIGRDEETEKILQFLYTKNDSYLVPFVSIHGQSGTGKSTIVRFACENISDSVSYSFVNLRKAKTIFGCANLILDALDYGKVKSSEGINTAIDNIEKSISEILTTEKKNHFILVLDEFDQIFSDVRSNPSDFVYKLLHLVETLRTQEIWLCIVAISNTNLADYTLDDRVKSRMDNCEVFFPPYTIKDLLLILKERAQQAFVDKISTEVLKQCAKLSGTETGDCRRALQLLRLSGECAKGKEISIEHVDGAAKELEKDNLEQILKTATPHQKLLLIALAMCVLYTEKEDHTTQEIYEKY